MVNQNVTIDIDLMTKNFEKALRQSTGHVKKFEKQSTNSFEGIKKSFGAVKVAAAAVATAVAGISVALVKSTQAAATQEKAMNQLATAMRMSGEFSRQSFKDLQRFTSQLQALTGIGDETSMQMLSLAKSFGASNKQAKQIIKAAADMSAAMGIDFETAVRQLSKTMGGYAGELGEVNPKIKELTKEQLRAGKAAEVVAKQFAGAAEQAGKTFSGQMSILSANFGDFLEQIGFLITQNPVVIDAIEYLNGVFKDLGQMLEDNRAQIIILVKNGLNALIKGTNAILPALLQFSKYLINLSIIFNEFQLVILKVANAIAAKLKPATDMMTKAFGLLGRILGKVSDKVFKAVEEQLNSLGNTLGSSKGPLDDVIKLYEKKQENLRKTRDWLEKNKDAQFETIKVTNEEIKKKADLNRQIEENTKSVKQNTNTREEASKEVRDLQKQALLAQQDAAKVEQDIVRINSDKQLSLIKRQFGLEEALKFASLQRRLEAEDKHAEAIARIRKRAAEALKDQKLDTLTADVKVGKVTTEDIDFGETPIKGFFTNLFEGLWDSLNNTWKNIINGIIEAAGYIYDAIVGAFDAADYLFGGGFINDLSNQIERFGSIPARFVEAIENFDEILEKLVDEFPAVIEKLTTKLPVIFEKIIKNLDIVLNNLIKSLPKIADFLIQALPRLITELSEAVADLLPVMVKQLSRVLSSLLSNLPKMLGPLIEMLSDALSEFLVALPGLITEFFNALPKIVKQLADEIPELVEVLADNLDKIIIAFVEGVAEASDKIIIALVDSLIIGGGLERIVKSLIQAMPRVATALINSFISAMRGHVQTFISLFTKVFGNAFDNIKDNVKSAGQKFVDGVKSGFQKIGSTFSNLGRKIIDGVQVALSTTEEAFVNLGKSIWDGLKEALSGAGELFSNLGKGIWDGLKNGLKDVGKIVEDGLNAINPANLLKKLFKLDGGGRGPVEKNLGIDVPFASFAAGGVVKVPGSAKYSGNDLRNDTVPAMLSPGELVVPRSLTQNPQFMEGLRLLSKVPSMGSELQFRYSWNDFENDIKGVGKTVTDTVGGVVNAATDPWGYVKDRFWGWFRGGLGFANGGIVPNVSSNQSYSHLASTGGSGADLSRLEAAVSALGNQPIVVQIDNKEVFRANRKASERGFGKTL